MYQDEKAKSEDIIATLTITFTRQGCREVYSLDRQNYMLKSLKGITYHLIQIGAENSFYQH